MDNNYNIFSILNPSDNILLTNLSNSMINKILNDLDKYYLELRDNIGNHGNNTSGFEFEFEDANKSKIIDDMLNCNFNIKETKIYEDDSIPDGYEICTPILNISNINWNRVKKLCYIIKRNGYIGNNCGSHIHIGAQVLNNNINALTNFASLIIAYENIIARFFYGNFINERMSMHTYAPPVASDWYDEYLHFNSDFFSKYRCQDFINILSGYYEKKQFINLSNVIHLGEKEINNTFEFRAPNGTLDPIIWQNNLNLIVKLMRYCNNPNFNLEIIENRIKKNLSNLGNYKFYRDIDIDGALELCDLIFDNNLDKIYFLRQYLKDKHVSNSRVLVLSKKFTETPYNDNDIV